MTPRDQFKPDGGVDRVNTVALELVSVIALIMAVVRLVTVEFPHLIESLH